MDVNDVETGPFASLYEAWVLSGVEAGGPDARDAEMRGRLEGMFREAWGSGDANEQLYVLFFVFDLRDAANGDLILEGLASEHRRVAKQAAVLTGVMEYRAGMELTPEFRRSYRAAVRRFPETNGFRPQEFYGHVDGDDDDWERRPFVNVFEDWMADEYPRDDGIRERLVGMYREAWERGDGVDRAFVLEFLEMNCTPAEGSLAQKERGLVVEALRSEDEALAPTALFAADFISTQGVDLGEGAQEALLWHGRRYWSPVSAVTVQEVLERVGWERGRKWWE